MNAHRNDLAALSTAELRQRRDQLVTGLPRAAAFLAGSLACGVPELGHRS